MVPLGQVSHPHLAHQRARFAMREVLAEGLRQGLSCNELVDKLYRELPWHGFSVLTRQGGARPSNITRFEAKYTPEPNTGCWLWTAGLNAQGYGMFSDKTHGPILAHLWSYKSFIGNPRRGATIDHRCGMPACVNPEHLEAVSRGANSERMLMKRALARAHAHALAMGEIATRQQGRVAT